MPNSSLFAQLLYNPVAAAGEAPAGPFAPSRRRTPNPWPTVASRSHASAAIPLIGLLRPIHRKADRRIPSPCGGGTG